MHKAFTLTGTLTDAKTVILDEPLPLPQTKVRLVVEPIPPTTQRAYQKTLTEIHKRQQARGHQPPTKEAVEAYLKDERESWQESE